MPADVLNGKADEHMISQFVQNCLMPLINTIESALDSDLLSEAEKVGHYYFAFDTSELTRGDFASRMNAYAVAYQNNFYQLDEIRAMEDLPPLDFNFIKLGLDAVLVDPKTREIYTPNTGKLEKMNAEHLTDEQLRGIMMMKEEKRFNPNHNPDNGQFTSGGGSILRIPQIPASTVSKKIAAGVYSLNLSWQNYNKHLEGHRDFERYKNERIKKGKNPQSKLTISRDEAQKIINEKSGTGIVKARRDGTAMDIEYIVCDKVIGYYFTHGEYYPTNKAAIHHSKDGSHLVPDGGGKYG